MQDSVGYEVMLIELLALELPESLNICKADISCWYAKAMRCSSVKALLAASLDVEHVLRHPIGHPLTHLRVVHGTCRTADTRN